MTILLAQRRSVLGIFAGLFLSMTGAVAQVGISNLAEVKTDDFSVDNFQSLGVRFTTGTGTWDLTSVDLFVSIFTAFPPEANFVVALYSVSGGLPDQKIVDLTGPNPTSGTLSNLNYVPATATTLQPSTSYYVAASSTSMAGSYIWGSTTSTGFTGLPGWTLFAGNAVNSGGGWGLNTGLAAPMVSVNVAAVPEPSPITLAALAFIALAAYRHRRTARL